MVFMMQLFAKIVEMSISASIVIACVLVLRFFLKNVSKKLVYILWLFVAFRLLCPISVEAPFSVMQGAYMLGNKVISSQQKDIGREEHADTLDATIALQDNAVKNENVLGTEALQHNSEMKNASVSQKLGNIIETMKSPLNISAIGFSFQVPTFLVIVWLFGFMVVLVASLVRLQCLKKCIRFGTKVDGNVLDALKQSESMDTALAAMKQSESIDGVALDTLNQVENADDVCDVIYCEQLCSPFVYGLWNPRIVMPYGLPKDSKDMIFAHEQYHIAHKDHWIKALAFMMVAVYWFCPFVWIAFHYMTEDMEMRCDEAVLAGCDKVQRQLYSRTLLAFSAGNREFLTYPVAFGENATKHRIKSVLSSEKKSFTMVIIGIVIIAVAGLFCLTDGLFAKKEQSSSTASKDSVEMVYELKQAYVGDASKDSQILAGLQKIYGDFGGYSLEIQSEQKPFSIVLHMKKEPDMLRMWKTAAAFMVLVDNCDCVKWDVANSAENSLPSELTREDMMKQLSISNSRKYADSLDDFQEFMYMLEDVRYVDDEIVYVTDDLDGENTNSVSVKSAKAGDEKSVTTQQQLQPFYYTGNDEVMKTVCEYMTKGATLPPDSEVYIPAPVIYGTVEQGDETLIYGNLWSFYYRLDGDTLQCTGGGEQPSCLHAKKQKDGYVVTSVEVAQDGEEYLKSIKKFCRNHDKIYNQFVDGAGAGNEDDSIRKELLAMYVDHSGLPVTYYKDFGWDAVKIK